MLFHIALIMLISCTTVHANTTSTIRDYAEQAYKNHNMPQAIKLYQQALVHDQETLEALFKLGTALAHQQEFEQAFNYFSIVTTLKPTMWEAHFYKGTCLSNLQRYKQAVLSYQEAIKINPNIFTIYIQLSDTLAHLQKFKTALRVADKAISMNPQSAQVYTHKALIHHQAGDIKNAITVYQKALSLAPNNADIIHGLAYMYRLKGDMPSVIKELKKELALRPDYPLAHIALSHAHWVLGNWDKVWEEREWRWKAKGFDPSAQKTPLWEGQDLTNKTVLLYAENGFGDTIQFIRFAKDLKQRGAHKIVCEVQKPLIPLLRMCEYIDTIVAGNLGKLLADTSIDYQMPLMSSPRPLKIDEKKLTKEPYIQADSKLVATWQKKLGEQNRTGKKLKIGLCWHVEQKHEATASPLCKRAMHLKNFAPLADLKHVELYSLQKFHDEDELKQWQSKLGLKTFGPNFDTVNGAFMDTAAVIANLDIVITVDTSVAHLAGAMGKPVWMLLPTSPDCRWQLERTDSPWYPSMRIFRQTTLKDWQPVIKNIATQLTHLEKTLLKK